MGHDFYTQKAALAAKKAQGVTISAPISPAPSSSLPARENTGKQAMAAIRVRVTWRYVPTVDLSLCSWMASINASLIPNWASNDLKA